jgi:peptidoglycan/xylan/chitin deacetylase (PgdA/CDA1 family)
MAIMRGPLISASRIWLKLVLKTMLAIPGLAFHSRRPAIRVLFYHRVNPHPFDSLGPVSRELTVAPEEFAWQLKYLAVNGYRSLTLDDFYAMATGRAKIDPKAILITFDDGYEDNLIWAAPLLAKYGFSAVVFPVIDFVGRETAAVWPQSDPPGLGRFLSADQLCDLRSRGFEIGSHTLRHPILTAISQPECDIELSESRRRLQAMIGSPVTALAYPGGNFDGEVEAAVRRAGYLMAFTTIPGKNRANANLTALRRTEVSRSDSRLVFRLKLAGALDWLWFKDTEATRAILRRVNSMLTPLAR